MQSRSLPILLCLWLILPLSWFALQATDEQSPDGTHEITFTALGGKLFSMSKPAGDGPMTERFHATGWLLALAALAAFYPVAWWISSRVQRVNSASLRWVVTTIAVVTVLAALAATGLTRYYWGFWFRRPPATMPWWELTTVTSLTKVSCKRGADGFRCTAVDDQSLEWAFRYCKKEPYYCRSERLPVALRDAGLLPRRAILLQPPELARVGQVLSTNDLLVPADPGYRGNESLGGYVASGTTSEDRRVLAIAVEGLETSNDHYPTYEVLADDTAVLKHRHFFSDVAGLEGLEFVPMLLMFATGGILVGMPVVLVAAAITGVVRRQ